MPQEMKIKKVLFWILKLILGIVVFLLLWIIAAFIFPRIKINKDFVSCQGNDCVTMYVRSNGMHTDVVFPVQDKERDWRNLFPIDQYEGVDSSFTYIAIGWGDKGFYLDTPTWADLKVSTALKATVGASGSAMHIVYLPSPPSTVGEYGKQLHISREQYRKMLDYIDAAFVKNGQGQVILIPHPDYDINDHYYEAKGSYSIFKTCNVWTSKCLKTGGITNGIWAPTAASVMLGLPDE